MEAPRHAMVGSVLAWRALLAVAAVRCAVPLASTAFVPVGPTADELYYLACADHMAWGYVDHPPFSVAVLAAVRAALGDSLLALRVVPALCSAGAVLATGALARELGGGSRAQTVAALAMAAAPLALALGLPFSMNPLEHLLWPLAALALARLQNGASPRTWIALGLVLGIALLNKLSTLWLGAGLAAGLAASPARAWLATRWPWLAAGLALLLFAPHLAWQAAHDAPTLAFVRNNAAAREGIDAAVVMRTPWAFAASQLVGMGPLAAPLWLGGLVHLLRAPALRHQRALGWAFASVFAGLALSGRASVYYLVGAFPIVFAAGGVWLERIARGPRLPAAVAALLVLQGSVLLPFVVPVVSADRYLALVRGARGLVGADPDAASLPPVYAWMAGAREVTDAVARAVATLPPAERRRAGVLATTFGEAGALAHLGPDAGLPPVIGTHNSFWLWGTRGLDGAVLVVVADADDPLLRRFARCERAARVACPHCEPRLRDRPVFVCRDPARPLPELWPGIRRFG